MLLLAAACGPPHFFMGTFTLAQGERPLGLFAGFAAFVAATISNC
jgi:hypothetical protein